MRTSCLSFLLKRSVRLYLFLSLVFSGVTVQGNTLLSEFKDLNPWKEAEAITTSVTNVAGSDLGMEEVEKGLEFATLITSYDYRDVSCHGGNDGFATVYISGGTPPYTYEWSNGATTQTIENLTADTYRLVARDAAGKKVTCRIKISEPKKLSHQIKKENDVTTYGGSDGSASVTVSGGTPPYTYLWDNGETTATAYSLNAGNHRVDISDANGCVTVCYIQINEPEPEVCENDADCDGIPSEMDCDDNDPDNTNLIPDPPTNLECWQTASYDADTCQWVITGEQDPEPTDLECWQTASFDSNTCEWVITGEQDPEPTDLECWQTASFDGCQWVITGEQDPEPTDLECWQTASFDSNTCEWVITGEQEPEPTDLECGQTAEFNTNTCSWEIIDSNEDCGPDIEICDGIDNDGDGDIDEGFDLDNDGIADCEDDNFDPPSPCGETAYARDPNNNPICFIDDGFSNWGWTNSITEGNTYRMEMYAGAGQCDYVNKGWFIGYATVVYEEGKVSVAIQLFSGVSMTEAQLYIGNGKYPLRNNGSQTVAPGSYPYKAENLQGGNRINYTFEPDDEFSGPLYVIVHATTCSEQYAEQTEEKGAISRTKVTVFQEHRSEVLNVDLDISYDAILNTNFIDSSGRTVLTPGSRKVNKGKNLLEYDMRMVPSQVLIMNVYTGREIISKKILYRK